MATGSVWRSDRRKNRKLCLGNGVEGLVGRTERSALISSATGTKWTSIAMGGALSMSSG